MRGIDITAKGSSIYAREQDADHTGASSVSSAEIAAAVEKGDVMQTSSSQQPEAVDLAAGPPRMLSHLAYVTPDAEATVDFYTRVMGMEFVLAVMDDQVPSTGDPFPYFHI